MTSRPLFISVLESTVIFGPMLHVGCASASTVTSASSSGRSATERAAAGGEHEALHLPVGRRTDEPQALVQRAVLAVDRHEFGARRGAQRLHDRPGGDEALLVRERQPLAGTQGLDRDGEAGEADDPVHHDVGAVDHRGEFGDHLGARQRVGDLAARRLVGDGHQPGKRRACSITAAADRPTASATTS
jgi:hypothetical protein